MLDAYRERKPVTHLISNTESRPEKGWQARPRSMGMKPAGRDTRISIANLVLAFWLPLQK